jgi:3-oxoacyl-[acyl-carrier protein] reductase
MITVAMDLGLGGRTALVCGASAGIGLACAEALAEEGANVVVLARRREELERQAARIGALTVPGSRSASYITGNLIQVDGGLSRSLL